MVGLALLAALAACGEQPMATDTPAPASAPAPSAAPFMGGVFLGDADTRPDRVGAAIAGYAQMVGRHPALVKSFHTLECDFAPSGWCGRLLREIAGTGATNFVALDLKWPGSPSQGVLDAVLAGAADASFARVARQLAAVGGPVLVEPAWEMNGNWSYSWQGVANGGDSRAPQKYAAAWRRMVDIFRREGASNVRWVFNPNAGNPLTYQATGASHWNWYAHYYPGDAYVDYVGAHAFNGPSVFGGGYQDFHTMFDSAKADHTLSDMARRFPGKPIIVGEFATEETPGRDKGEWVADAYRRLRAHPNVVGAVWFNMNKEADWRVDSSPSSLAAFRTAMAAPGVLAAYDDRLLSRTGALAAR